MVLVGKGESRARLKTSLATGFQPIESVGSVIEYRIAHSAEIISTA